MDRDQLDQVDALVSATNGASVGRGIEGGHAQLRRRADARSGVFDQALTSKGHSEVPTAGRFLGADVVEAA